MTLTQNLARSLRLAGITAAVAFGIVGFATVDAVPAPVEVAVVAKGGPAHLPQLPQQACDNASKHASSKARPFLSCRDLDTPGEIEGPPIFS